MKTNIITAVLVMFIYLKLYFLIKNKRLNFICEKGMMHNVMKLVLYMYVINF